MKKFIVQNWKTIVIIILIIGIGYFYITRKISTNKIENFEVQIEQHIDSIKILEYALIQNAEHEQTLLNEIKNQQETIDWQIEEYNDLKERQVEEIEKVEQLNAPESIDLLEMNLDMRLELIRDTIVLLPPLATIKINKVFIENRQSCQKVVMLETRIDTMDGLVFSLSKTIENKNEKIGLLDEKIGQQNGVIIGKDGIIKEKDKVIKRNRIKHLLTGAGLGGAAVLLLLLL